MLIGQAKVCDRIPLLFRCQLPFWRREFRCGRLGQNAFKRLIWREYSTPAGHFSDRETHFSLISGKSARVREGRLAFSVAAIFAPAHAFYRPTQL
jgi:hypothetical protein